MPVKTKAILEINSSEWKLLEDKFSRLLHFIAYKVGGDKILHDSDDVYQELCMTLISSAETFISGLPEVFSIEELVGDIPDQKTISDPLRNARKGFSKYIKTSIWNKKNKSGTKITKRNKQLHQVSFNEALFDDHALEPIESFAVFGNDVLDDDSRKIVNALNINSALTHKNGKINLKRLSEHLNKTSNYTEMLLEKLRKQLKDYEAS